MQRMERAAGETEGAPDPARARRVGFDVDGDDAIMRVEHDGIEAMRLVDGKEQEREALVRQVRERGFRKPNRIGQAHQHRLVETDERHRAEDRVAQPIAARLHDIGDGGRAVTGAVIIDDVVFAG